MQWYGYDLDRRALEGYSSDLRQFADIRLLTLDDGAERGVRVAEVRTGSGFDFTVLLDRGMDIGTATYRGVPLAWHSGTGAANPSRYEPGGLGWLRTFHGGLLALCGMTQAGFAQPDRDSENGEVLGLHGRVGTIPAYDIGVERGWNGDDWRLRLRGTVDEVVLFGHKLRLEREIAFAAGEAAISITDRVRNFGGLAAPLMMLYHCNLGYPIVSPDSELITPAFTAGLDIVPRDEVAAVGQDIWNRMQAPTPGYAEQVFWHTVPQSEEWVTAAITNHKLGLGVAFDFDPTTLTHMTEWKQMGYGDYTVGIEPGNCLPIGRVKAREMGTLRMLSPGETDTFRLNIRIVGA